MTSAKRPDNRLYTLRHPTTGSVVATVNKLDGFWEKGIGLIGRSSLEPATGVWLSDVASIHTFFVRFPIDILFLDRQFRLLKSARGVSPWNPLVRCPGAWHTLELAAGTLDSLDRGLIGKVWLLESSMPNSVQSVE